MAAPSSPPPPNLDPPFRGYIETTFDALLVFEAARRGMIPRVTRRLIERERGMVQSGAVFVFDEHESGIKRWTDGLVWSPSRILGNFLVYRETDKRSPGTPTKTSSTSPPETSPSASTPLGRPGTGTLGMSGFDSPTGMGHMQPSVMDAPSSSMHDMTEPPPLGQGALARPRSASEGGGAMDRQRERQLVGSLTNSYKFKEGGLVKKTMSVSVNGFNQHMVSYYSVQDVLAGKLRAPSTIPELSSLEISQEYLNKQNFRFPPMIERGPDGINRYRGEAEEPQSPTSPNSQFSFQSFPPSSSSGEYYDGGYSQMTSHAPRVGSPRNRSVTVPMPVPLPPHAQSMAGSYVGPNSHGSTFYESPTVGAMHYAPSLARQSSSSSIHSSASGAIRPSSSSRRYDPYGSGPGSATSPRLSGGMQYQPNLPHRRQSQPIPPENLYSQSNSASYDVKPNPYNYHPPSTAPSTFSAFYTPDGAPEPGHTHGGHPHHQHPSHIQSSVTSPTTTTFAHAPAHGYAAWQPVPHQPAGVPPSSSGSDSTSRLLPTINTRTDFGNPPSSAGSGSTSGGSRMTSGQQPSPLQSSQTAGGSDPWVHTHPNVNVNDNSSTNSNVWSDANQSGGHNGGGGPNQPYIQPLHHQHDDWARSNAGAIV
ncbi:hypothetical protein V865_004061 [Kwoniella europaea PYCC6329]|uniref:cAMP-independent regulatory protein n=1 Tax=Kwoniella europaea PYCC6329 TaxID=1423913 RepID=A0AAX4KHI9_9TREE